MNNNYGKLFLLFAAIGLILLATSGKGLAIWEVLTGKTSLSQGNKNETIEEKIEDYDEAGSGHGGVMA